MASRADTDSYHPWFERWTDLEKWERERFRAYGLPWAPDAGLRDLGYLVIHSKVEYQGQPLKIAVVYPTEYPELPPWVYADRVVLDRHQLPFRANFCLLERPIDSWQGREWGAADLIAEQLLPLLRDSEAGPEVVRAREAPIPEPASAFFGYADNAVVLVPANLTSTQGDSGSFEVKVFDTDRYLLTKVGSVSADTPLAELLPLHGALKGKWKRVDKHPSEGPFGEEVLDWVRRTLPELLKSPAPPQPPRKRGRRRSPTATPSMQIVGLVFPEERAADGAEHDAWMFLGIRNGTEGFLLHSEEASVEQRQRRIPDLAGLETKSALVLGAGSLGSDVALHLSRAGIGRLVVIDSDRFEVNNAVRHALGVEKSGLRKAEAVAQLCRLANPFCDAASVELTVGGVEPQRPPLKVLEEAVAEADLLVETTGVNQIELLAGRVAWDHDLPIISCWMTEGSWAGEVVRIRPGATMCMTCFHAGQRQGELLSGDAAPEDEAMVVAQGCTHPTVSGAGFDAAETAAMAARLACQTLLDDDKYPSPDWDHAVSNFRRDPKDEDFPRAGVEALAPNAECERCGQGAG
ncbi:MAG: hypothetical protein QOI31_1749 [Solirubrobacterales bacterium]|jgi:threonine dehydrogenase-like Zn-dependent dehydrogenase|nr:hypothetical protein [Solirubrobacterales bacterium]